MHIYWMRTYPCSLVMFYSIDPGDKFLKNIPYLYFRFWLSLPDGYFSIVYSRPNGWTHIVLNFIGPNDEEGVRIYYNGEEVKRDTIKSSSFHAAGDGRIVVGRYYPDRDERYACVQVDEPGLF